MVSSLFSCAQLALLFLTISLGPGARSLQAVARPPLRSVRKDALVGGAPATDIGRGRTTTAASGGSPASQLSLDEHPFVASLVENGRHKCGGVLISPTHVLTAAQCLPKLPRGFEVHLGGTKLYKPKENMKIQAVKFHPRWKNAKEKGNDLAIIELVGKSSLQPVSLPLKGMRIDHEELLTAMGWGRTSGRGGFATTLQIAKVTYIAPLQCKRSGIQNGRKLKKGMMCVGGQGAGACEGDQGAPIITENPSNSTLLGIVSFQTSSCGSFGSPGIASRIDRYVNWIKKVTKT